MRFDPDDGVHCDFQETAIRKARKKYRCDGCDGTIQAGELYSRTEGKWDGEFGKVCACGICELHLYRLHIEELGEGCDSWESWCQLHDLGDYLAERNWYGDKGEWDKSSREDGQRYMRLKLASQRAAAAIEVGMK